MTPLIKGTSDGPFYHWIIPDTFYADGGYPNVNNFDVLDVTENGVVAAIYPPYGEHTTLPAAIGSSRINAVGKNIRSMWFGLSLMHMRDAVPFPIMIRVHIFCDVQRSWGGAGSPCGDITEAYVPKPDYLSQNYPNPFNPSTTIRFTVKEKGLVSLEIYNVKGRLVTTLIDGLKEPGSYDVTWDGMNDRGIKVASGVYFCRLKTDSYVETKKMVLIQ